MAVVIDTGNIPVGTAASYILNNNDGVIDYLQHNFNNYYNRIKDKFSDYANNLKNTFSSIVKEKHEIKNMLYKNNIYGDNDIYYINDSNTTNARMRQYIMADPYLYREYENYKIEGYYDRFSFREGDNISPEWRDEYLHTIDGTLVEDGEDYYITNVSLDHENPLSFTEQIMIQESVRKITDYLIAGIDLTDNEL